MSWLCPSKTLASQIWPRNEITSTFPFGVIGILLRYHVIASFFSVGILIFLNDFSNLTGNSIALTEFLLAKTLKRVFASKRIEFYNTTDYELATIHYIFNNSSTFIACASKRFLPPLSPPVMLKALSQRRDVFHYYIYLTNVAALAQQSLVQ